MHQMITEKRLKSPRHSIYYRSLIDDSGTVVREEAFDCRIITQKIDGKTIICIMDAQGGLRRDATRYVNEKLAILGLGTSERRGKRNVYVRIDACSPCNRVSFREAYHVVVKAKLFGGTTGVIHLDEASNSNTSNRSVFHGTHPAVACTVVAKEALIVNS